MNLQQCWSSYTKAEELLKSGHWPQAHYLLDDVLQNLPNHIQHTANDPDSRPCQLVCLISGLHDAAIHQAEILNNMGQQQRAFDALNQAYGLLQFMSIETNDLITAVASVLDKHSTNLLLHLSTFCMAQRDATWQLEYQDIEKAHLYFTQLKHSYGLILERPTLN